jgi:hypothetical protein
MLQGPAGFVYRLLLTVVGIWSETGYIRMRNTRATSASVYVCIQSQTKFHDVLIIFDVTGVSDEDFSVVCNRLGPFILH